MDVQGYAGLLFGVIVILSAVAGLLAADHVEERDLEERRRRDKDGAE